MSAEHDDIGLEDFTTTAPQPDASAQTDNVADAEAKNTLASEQMEAMYEIPVKITAIIGTVTMPVNQLLKLGRGAVVELDRKLGEAVDIYANNRLIARGEVVVMDDNHIGVTMTEILSSSPVSAG